MNRVFEWLFKYPPVVFERGEISFAALSSTSAWMAFGAVALGGAYMIVRRVRQPLPRRLKILLIGFRFGAFALLIFCLLQPVVIVPSVIPHSATVALLVDDSLSMGIPDVEGRSRLEAVRALLAPESPFWRRLTAKFHVRLFSLSGEDLSMPTGHLRGARTDLGAGLERVLATPVEKPLAAVVLISDGGHNTRRDLSMIPPLLLARRVPVHTIGVGQEQMARDVEVVRVNVPRRILRGSSVKADLLLRCGDSSLGRVTLRVTEDGRTLRSAEIECAEGSRPRAVSLEFTPAEAGMHRYVFIADPRPQEPIVENNRVEAIVEVRDEVARVLYIEGEPRWEYGKIRAAVADDEQLNLVSIVRTARGKFYRQGVESGEELAKGFPERPEELFRFKGLILGSVEAGFFTREQLEWMEAFVARRGGGLLMLGGPRAFSAGGYALTPLADVLPLELRRPSEIPREGEAEGSPHAIFGSPGDSAGTPRDLRIAWGPRADVSAYAPVVTEAGREHPLARLADDPKANERAWRALPRVTVPEIFTRAKPGAIVVLEGVKRSRGGPRPILLAVQRYGRGLGLAFTPSDSWRWQMEMSSADLSHETFWKQMLRYLVSFADDPVNLLTESDTYEVGDEVPLRVEVRDELFRPVADAALDVQVQTPGGVTERVRVHPDPENEGEYVGRISVREPGIYRLQARARWGDRAGSPRDPKIAWGGHAEAHLVVRVPDREYREAGQKVELLKWLARETGGRYAPLSDAEALIPELEYVAGEHSMRVTKELWDMPIVFLLLVGLLSLEWGVRRRWGLI
ncbi:hypothetical protein HRbin08_01971 [bacterium HR08]|nr:hypothetical protein HRbin08_01971 [bacterium HR08]